MTSTSPSPAYNTFHQFMDLPQELRIKVYQFALTTKATLFLPLPNSDSFTFKNTALLSSSENVKKEALPVFYAVNHFHFDMIDWQTLLALDDCLIMMRHVSIEVSTLNPWITDGQLANPLNLFLHKFRQLHSFSLYIIGSFVLRGSLSPPLNSSADMLRNLGRSCKSISLILSLENENHLRGLRDAICPHDEWQQQIFNYWPHYLTGRGFGLSSRQIRVWSRTQPRCGFEDL